jgi:hypothetical protein
MYCFGATVSNCANAQPLSLNFGYLSPAGIIAGPVKGVIVFFNGGDGTSPVGNATGTPNGEFNMANQYFTQGYEIVQLAWASPWQQTDLPNQPNNPYPGNVQNAACRPATFLNYVYNNIYLPVSNNNSTAGMCAQGASAGSAQIAYSLAYYGAGSYLDNVELISGPVLADIDQGCEEPPPSNVTICPAGQYGCQLGTGGSSWSLAPTYLSGANTAVGKWTYDSSCTSSGGTSGTSDANWLKQSIVDQAAQTGGSPIPVPNFYYPSTGMSAWLCRSLQSQQSAQNCSQHYSEYQDYCPNNSSPQGEIFYSQITQATAPYNVFAVDQCGGPEGASSTLSNVPGDQYAVNGVISGFNAITFDMAGAPPNSGFNVPAQCIHRTH